MFYHQISQLRLDKLPLNVIQIVTVLSIVMTLVILTLPLAPR